MKKFLFSIVAILAVVASYAIGSGAAAFTTGGLILANAALPLTIDDEFDRAAYDRIKALFEGVEGFLVQPASF